MNTTIIDTYKIFSGNDLFTIGCELSSRKFDETNQEMLKDDIEQTLSTLATNSAILGNNHFPAEPQTKQKSKICVIHGESAIYQYVGILLNLKAPAKAFGKTLNEIGNYLVTTFAPTPNNEGFISPESAKKIVCTLDTSLLECLSGVSCNIIVLPTISNGEEVCEVFLPQKNEIKNRMIYNIVIHSPNQTTQNECHLKKSLASSIAVAIFDCYERNGGEEWVNISKYLTKAYNVMSGNSLFHTDILYPRYNLYYQQQKNIQSYYPAYIPFAARLCNMGKFDIGTQAEQNTQKAYDLIECYFQYKRQVEQITGKLFDTIPFYLPHN